MYDGTALTDHSGGKILARCRHVREAEILLHGTLKEWILAHKVLGRTVRMCWLWDTE